MSAKPSALLPYLNHLIALGRSGFGCATGRFSAFSAYRCSAPYGRYPTAGTYSYKPSLRFAYRHIALVWSIKSGVARSGRGCAPSLTRSYLICAVSAKPSALLQSLNPLELAYTNALPIIAPCKSPLRPTHNGRSR